MGSMYKLSIKKLSWQDLCKRPLGKISATDLYAISLYKVSTIGVLAKISVQDLYKSSVWKISVGGLLARSQQISLQFLCARSPKEGFCQDLCT